MKRFQYLIASILVHTLVTLAFFWGSDRLQARFTPSPTAIEVVYQDPNPKPQEKTFVTDPTPEQELKKAVEKLEKQARFLSRRMQRVEQEQIASRSGQTSNRSAENQRNQSATQKLQPIPQPTNPWDPPPLAGGGLEARRELKQTQQQSHEAQVRLNESTIAEFIPDVQQGGFTSLNTDQFLFYTFYARINEQIRNRWIQNLRQFTAEAHPQKLEALSRRMQTTELEVLLDKNGNYVKTLVHGAAEDPGLDAAAALAFRMAQPFNNPPTEIVAPDGYIHLHYSFYVGLRPRSLARQ